MRRRLSTPPVSWPTLGLFFVLLGFGQTVCVPGVNSEDIAAANRRIGDGLVALYDFSATSGPVVSDRSGVGEPLDLQVTDLRGVSRREGALEVRGKTLIWSSGPANKIIEAVRRSGELSIEAWVRPANAKQEGPARIVTLSKNTSERNFTLGQERDRFDVRLRATKTSGNGMPSISSPSRSLNSQIMHVVYTRDRDGRARIYINGRPAADGQVNGDLTGWDRSHRFALANEMTADRPWQGTYFLVAVYSRALAAGEIAEHFKAGHESSPAPEIAERRQARYFEREIAPLLARHCLECHDSVTKKGGLDLSRKKAAFAGGESGDAIVPGKSAASLLWEQVESDEMPKERPLLTGEEKAALKKWVDEGATWSTAFEVIDPTIYASEGRADQLWIQRLTRAEYIETVRSALGVDVTNEAREILPPDLRADGFSNTAYNLAVDLKHVDAYARLAEIIVGRLDVKAFAARFSKSQRLTDDDMRKLIAEMGKWLLRGPLGEREIVTYRGISTTVAATGGDFEEAVSFVIEAMLQSPRFIYRIENQRGDGSAWPVGQHELASRLSYILWGGPPDAELMRAADRGELADRDRVEQQVRRMLADPRAIDRSVQFLYEWLDLGRLDNLKPDEKKFPYWNPKLAEDMRDETLTFFKEIAWKQQRPLADLFNADVTFVTPELAKHYGLSQADRATADKTPARFDLSSVPGRGGLLTQGSVLTVGGDEASMVTRGLFVLRNVLRGTVKDPPPCVDTTPVPTKEGRTQRGIAEGRIANAACGGCHVKFEPLAFGLEKFDGLGAYHDQDEHGNRLRDDGQILVPGAAKPVAYQSSAELMDLLADSDRVRETMTWKIAQFALGRPIVAADVPILKQIHSSAQAEGGTYVSVISSLVLSDLVQLSRTEMTQ